MLKSLLEWFLSLIQRPAPEPTPQKTRQPMVSSQGLRIIKHFEGLVLTTYLDAVGKPTIGYGDTGPHVKMGDTITEAEAEQRLIQRLRTEFEPGVLSVLTRGPHDYEFDAMVSLAYNVGVRAFQGSTLVRKFNAGDTDGAADEFDRWHYAGKQSLLGLRRRRAAEKARFLGMTAAEAIAIGKATT